MILKGTSINYSIRHFYGKTMESVRIEMNKTFSRKDKDKEFIK